GGDFVYGLVWIPLLRRSSRLVAALFLFSFDDLYFEFKARIVVIVEPCFPCFAGIGFTGERAVGQLTDRVLKVLFGAVEVVVDTSVGASIKRGRVDDNTPQIVLRDALLEGLNLVGCGVFVVFIVDELAKIGPLVFLP